jgi:hypothetical protein
MEKLVNIHQERRAECHGAQNLILQFVRLVAEQLSTPRRSSDGYVSVLVAVGVLMES